MLKLDYTQMKLQLIPIISINLNSNVETWLYSNETTINTDYF